MAKIGAFFINRNEIIPHRISMLTVGTQTV